LKALLAEVALAAVVLTIAAGATTLGDRSLFVPPPEAVSEDFLRKMAEHRYAQARNDLASGLTARERTLEDLQSALEASHGTVENVQGDDSRLSTDHESTARATLRFHYGNRQLTLPLRFENGLWKVSSVDPIRRLAGSRQEETSQ
jgi:hypothetical protein